MGPGRYPQYTRAEHQKSPNGSVNTAQSQQFFLGQWAMFIGREPKIRSAPPTIIVLSDIFTIQHPTTAGSFDVPVGLSSQSGPDFFG